MHGSVARALIVVASLWTAGLQLFSSSSLAFRAAGSGWVIDVVNYVVIGLAGLALSDLVWHDILRRGLVLPSVPIKLRHQVCVWTYSALAGAFAIRAFVATGDPAMVLQVGLYYVLVSAIIGMEAVALANEERHECPPDSNNA